MAKIPLCQICKKEPVTWYVQDIAGELTASLPGWHYRGFHITKVCDQCKEDMLKQDRLEDQLYNPQSKATPPA